MPKTILPTRLLVADSSMMRRQNAPPWANCHDAPAANVTFGGEIQTRTSLNAFGTPYICERSYLEYVTSVLAGLVINSARIQFAPNLLPGQCINDDPGDGDLCLVEGVTNHPLLLTDYGAVLPNVALCSPQVPFATVIGSGVQFLPLNPAGLALINPLGVTGYCYRSSGDVNNNAPPIGSTNRIVLWGEWGAVNQIILNPIISIGSISAVLSGFVAEKFNALEVDYTGITLPFPYAEVRALHAPDPPVVSAPIYGFGFNDNLTIPITGLKPATNYGYDIRVHYSPTDIDSSPLGLFTTLPQFKINQSKPLSRQGD
jgi:hypothetical protein